MVHGVHGHNDGRSEIDRLQRQEDDRLDIERDELERARFDNGSRSGGWHPHESAASFNPSHFSARLSQYAGRRLGSNPAPSVHSHDQEGETGSSNQGRLLEVIRNQNAELHQLRQQFRDMGIDPTAQNAAQKARDFKLAMDEQKRVDRETDAILGRDMSQASSGYNLINNANRNAEHYTR